jgi:hypothetical protein
MIDTAHDGDPNDTAPVPPTADEDLGPQPPEIVVSVPDLLEPTCGALRDIETALIDEWTISWSGIDRSGRRLSGKLTRDFAVGPDSKSIVLRWNGAIDSEGA